VDELTEILEKFGMDFITKLGKVSFQIKKLSDKVTELSKATLNIKALGPKLNNVIENQEELKREIKILKSMTYQKSQESPKESVTRKDTTKVKPSKKDSIIDEIKGLKNRARSIENHTTLINELSLLREKIFDLTGGSKILYDISQITQELKEEGKITSKIIEDIREKADEWVEKL
jgi:hypothetical protein